MAGYDYAWTHHNPFATPPRSAPESAWTYDEYDGEPNALVTVDGTVYVRTDRELVAIDASDGSERWRQPRETGGGLKYVAGRLYDTGADELRALAPDGTEAWAIDVDDRVYSLLEREGWVYLSFRDTVRRLHADTGDVVAETDVEAYDAYMPATTGDLLYGGRYDLSAFDVSGGALETRWTVTPDRPYEGYAGPLACDEDRLYCPEETTPWSDTQTGRLAIYDAADGSFVAEVTLDNTPLAPAIDADSVYVSTSVVAAESIGSDGEFIALARDGEERWRYEPDASLQSPAVADGTVFLSPYANADAPLVAFDAETGDELWRRDVDASPELAIAGDTLYVGTDDVVRALRD